jgi:hypothetical protein
MLPELAAEVSVFILFLALIGYLVYEWYELGYYGTAYRPSKNKSSFERFLGHSAKGFIILFFLMFLISILFAFRILTYPDYLQYIQLPLEVGSYFLLFSFIFFVMGFALIIAMIIAGLSGRFMVNNTYASVIINRIDLSGTIPLEVREIYDQDEDFFYYLDLKGRWGSIRKNEIKSMKFSTTDTAIQVETSKIYSLIRKKYSEFRTKK